MENLRNFSLDARYLNSLDVLKQLPLMDLSIANISVDKLAFLQELTDLKWLRLENCGVKSLDDLGILSSGLQTLLIHDQALASLDGSENFEQLTSFAITGDMYKIQLGNLAGIEKMANLTNLNIGNTNLLNINGVESLTKLRYLRLTGNRYLSVLPDLTALPDLGKLRDGEDYAPLSRSLIFHSNAFTADELRAKLPAALRELPDWPQWLANVTKGSSDALPVPPSYNESGTAYTVTADTAVNGNVFSMTVPKESGLEAPVLTVVPSELSGAAKEAAEQLGCVLQYGFDITLAAAGAPVTQVPNGAKITVSIYSPEIFAGRTYRIFREKADGTVDVIVPSYVTRGLLKFETDHFSHYYWGVLPGGGNSGGARASSGSGTGFASYWVTATAGEGGSISPSGERKYAAMSDAVYTITPDEGYAVDRVLIDGEKEGKLSGGKYTFQSLDQPYTIHAAFKKLPGAAGSEAAASESEPEEAVSPLPAPNPATGDRLFAHLIG